MVGPGLQKKIFAQGTMQWDWTWNHRIEKEISQPYSYNKIEMLNVPSSRTELSFFFYTATCVAGNIKYNLKVKRGTCYMIIAKILSVKKWLLPKNNKSTIPYIQVLKDNLLRVIFGVTLESTASLLFLFINQSFHSYSILYSVYSTF